MNRDTKETRDDGRERALVAAFASQETAHDAARRLREDGFHRIWIGVTRSGELRSDDDSLGAKIGRFFRGESDGRTLTETLVKHGVDPVEADRIALEIEPEDVLLTVDGSNHPERAAQIIDLFKGDLLSDEALPEEDIDWTDPAIARLRDERLAGAAGSVPTVSEEFFVLSYQEGDEPELFDDETERRSDNAANRSTTR